MYGDGGDQHGEFKCPVCSVEGGRCLQKGVQDFEEDGAVTCCGEAVAPQLIQCWGSALRERASVCRRMCLLPEAARRGLSLPTEGSQPPGQREDGLARHPGLSVLLSV